MPRSRHGASYVHRHERAPSDLSSILRRIALRTGRGPLRLLWSLAYRAAARLLLFVLLRGDREASVYLKGSFAFREPLYGVSDVDLVIVTAATGERINAHWWRLRYRATLAVRLFQVWAYDERHLRDVVERTCLGSGSGDRGRPLLFGREAPVDPMGLLDRPGLEPPAHEWRLIRGKNPLPEVVRDAQQGRIACWLELQFWWRYFFTSCADLGAPHVPYLMVKLVAEPARIWAQLARGERLPQRREATLRRALELVPEEEPALRLALDLHRRLPRAPAAPLDELVPCLVRFSSRIAHVLLEEVEGEGTTSVRLRRGGDEPFPLADWRARVSPLELEATLEPVEGDSSNPAVIAAAAREGVAGAFPALRADGLLLLPNARPGRGVLRSVHCQATDPVPLAVTSGASTAEFSNAAGWSALDSAMRAVAEHRPWLEVRAGDGFPPGPWWLPDPERGLSADEVGRALIGAARAALFLESLEEGEPELALSPAAVAAQLEERLPVASGVAGLIEAHADERRLEELRALVGRFRCYSS